MIEDFHSKHLHYGFPLRKWVSSCSTLVYELPDYLRDTINECEILSDYKKAEKNYSITNPEHRLLESKLTCFYSTYQTQSIVSYSQTTTQLVGCLHHRSKVYSSKFVWNQVRRARCRTDKAAVFTSLN